MNKTRKWSNDNSATVNCQHLLNLKGKEAHSNSKIQSAFLRALFPSATVFVHVWTVSMQTLMAVISQAVMMIPGPSPGEEQSEQIDVKNVGNEQSAQERKKGNSNREA